MLTLLNEGLFFNGTSTIKCPLITCVGASNELPEDPSLKALDDRFRLRFWVEPIRGDVGFLQVVMAQSEPAVTSTFTLDDVTAARAQALALPFGDVGDFQTALLDLRKRMHDEKIYVSDRSWRKAVKLARASAVLAGRSTVTRRDLLILEHSLWTVLDERPKVVRHVLDVASPLVAEARRHLDQLRDLDESFPYDALATKAGGLDQGNTTFLSAVEIVHQIERIVKQEDGATPVLGQAQAVKDKMGRALLAASPLSA